MDIFERIQNVFKRLEIYIGLSSITEMTDILVKVMVEVLLVLALATTGIKQGKLSALLPVDNRSPSAYGSAERFLKKLVGRSDIEDSLRRLDKLTQEEHRMTSAQGLRATRDIGKRVIEGEHVFFASSLPLPITPPFGKVPSKLEENSNKLQSM
jgi:hypothetical protein